VSSHILGFSSACTLLTPEVNFHNMSLLSQLLNNLDFTSSVSTTDREGYNPSTDTDLTSSGGNRYSASEGPGGDRNSYSAFITTEAAGSGPKYNPATHMEGPGGSSSGRNSSKPAPRAAMGRSNGPEADSTSGGQTSGDKGPSSSST
jgi:hypothetical protein